MTIAAVVTATVVSLIAMVREVPLGTAFETASARALYGVLIVGFSVLWLVILGGAANVEAVVFLLPAAAAAIAGAAFTRSRDRRVPA